MTIIETLKHRLPRPIAKKIMASVVGLYIFLYKIKGRKIKIRWGTSDVQVFYHTLIQNEFAVPKNFKNIDFIIDAGANIGLSSLLFHENFPQAHIVAVEPESGNFDILMSNISGIPKISAIKKGIWSTNSYLKISNPNGQNWAFVTNEVNQNEDYDVEAITITSIMNDRKSTKIDLLKMDIEGAEKELFSKDTSRWLPHTRYLIIEVHGTKYKKAFKSIMEKLDMQHLSTNGENEYYRNTKFREKIIKAA